MRMAGKARGSPDKKVKTNVVPRADRVIATLQPAATHRVDMHNSKPVTCVMACPIAIPAHIRGKMKPPRRPPATVNEMDMSFAKPMRGILNVELIS